jgi:hypothetical protein
VLSAEWQPTRTIKAARMEAKQVLFIFPI